MSGGLTVNMGNKITLNVILLFVSYPKAVYSYSLTQVHNSGPHFPFYFVDPIHLHFLNGD